MGSTTEYKISGMYSLNGKREWKMEPQFERDVRIARITEAKEFIEAGIVPSDAEAIEFFSALGADVEALSFQDLKVLNELGALVPRAMFHYEREYSWDWLSALTPELRRQVEIEVGISVVNAWQEAKNANEVTPTWPLYIATPPDHTSITPQSITQLAADATGIGTVMTGEVLPMRAEAGSPDTLDFSSDAFSKVIDDPWGVLPPEQWIHRLGSSDLSSLPKDVQLEAARAYLRQVMDGDEEAPEDDDL